MSVLGEIAAGVLSRLIGLLEKRVNTPPAPKKPNHQGISDAEIERLFQKSTNKKGLVQ